MTAFILLALSIMCWAWSHRAIDRLVAWCRFMLSVFLMLLGLAYAVMGAVLWVLG